MLHLFNVIICTYGLSMLSWAHICVVVAYAYFYACINLWFKHAILGTHVGIVGWL